jgi:hypothetical protein
MDGPMTDANTATDSIWQKYFASLEQVAAGAR